MHAADESKEIDGRPSPPESSIRRPSEDCLANRLHRSTLHAMSVVDEALPDMSALNPVMPDEPPAMAMNPLDSSDPSGSGQAVEPPNRLWLRPPPRTPSHSCLRVKATLTRVQCRGASASAGAGSARRGPGSTAANGGGPKTGYKTVLCQFYLQGTCEKADQCLYAHGTSQLRNSAGLEIKDVQSSKTKTIVCAKFLQKVLKAAPNQGNAQSHAYFKTELCKMFMSGMYCSYENECQFAHGKHELRPKPKIDPKSIKPEERLKMAEKNKRSPFYKTRPCEGFRQNGKCDFDDICNFAHGEAELRPMPNMNETGFPSPAEKTRSPKPNLQDSMCKNVPHCQFGDSCKFAHSPMEMMRAQGPPGGMGGPVPPVHMGGAPRNGDFFKVSMCKNMEQGECQFGPTCRYAHHPSELRPNPK
ncbi:hypothetical protein TCAL_14906 [Tigriopus californicus]|uniref:C3H1-type domain-containing protein n=1 Tax=Tigriopus californicus TaxID=6832 RepID=A0A553P410_TIGCA|nr:hypothetical protein TCAL_14906 [Tigriopus californicus]